MISTWILITILAIDWGFGAFTRIVKKRRRIDFDRTINLILESDQPINVKVDLAKDLCRNTKGSEAFGAYLVLDYMEKELNKNQR